MSDDLRLTDHFAHHKAFIYSAFACVGLWIALIGPLGIDLPISPGEPFGILLVLGGWKAIVAGRSILTGAMGAHFGSTLDLDRMNPHQRRRHARVSGGLIIVGGIIAFLIGLDFDLVRHGVLSEPILIDLFG